MTAVVQADDAIRNHCVTGVQTCALPIYTTLSDSFTVTTVDGTQQTVTVTINGANDAAVIAGTTASAQAGTPVRPLSRTPCAATITPPTRTPTATGTLTESDVDNAANAFT